MKEQDTKPVRDSNALCPVRTEKWPLIHQSEGEAWASLTSTALSNVVSEKVI